MPPVWSGRKKTDAALRPVFWQRCALGALYVILALVLVTSLSTQHVTVLLVALAELTAAYLAVFVSISGGQH
jgi:hypothetical protein